MRGLRILAASDPFNPRSVRVAFYEERDGRVYAGEPVVMKEQDPAHVMRETATITSEAAQELMDRLWDCGIRPTSGHGSAGQLAATERHLEDMRRLVFNGPSSAERAA